MAILVTAGMTQGTDRTCAQCGAAFRGQTLKCAHCQRVERQCSTCGKPITSRYLQCKRCRTVPNACEHPGCDNPKVPGRGSKLCQEHRDSAYWRKLESLRSTICKVADCEEPKLLGHGYRYCAEHSANAAKGSPAYRARENVIQARRSRERRLGVTHDEFLAMLAAQDGVCAICGNGNGTSRQLSVDHDHATGVIRDLLCDRCNPMLGYARDRIAVLQAAIEYLKRHGIQS
jgi:hypothetical protein